MRDDPQLGMTHEFKGRREDFRLLTGQGRYTADHNMDGQAHGRFVRSNYAHAEILSLDIAEAAALPGVIRIFTYADIVAAGIKSPVPINFFRGKGGTILQNPERPALAGERVRFVGEPIALVIAETDAIAEEAAELVAVEYRDLSAIVALEAANAEGAIRLHDDIPGNVAIDYEYGDAVATDAAFAAAAHIASIVLDVPRISGNPMEPKSCLASFDAASGIWEIALPTQGMGELSHAFSHAIGEPADRFRIRQIDVGGAFGVRNELYPEYVAIVLAARAVGRPIKWVGTRAESIVSDHHGRGARLSGELALAADGKFLGVRIAWLADVGAYSSHAGPFINTAAAPKDTAVGVYDIPAAYGSHLLVFTNATPTTAYRGAGRPNVSYLMERLVDEAARLTGIDRIALRQRNLIAKDAFPYKTVTGSVYDSGDPPGLLNDMLEQSDWRGFEARRAEALKRGKLRGIGCAVFIEPSGGAGQEKISIKLDADGNLSLYTLSGASGQGHETTFPDLVANILGLSPDAVSLRASDPLGPALTGAGTFGSRSLITHGAALATGAREILRKGLKLAAADFEAAAADVVFEDGHYRIAGTDRAVSFSDLARRHATAKAHPLDTDITLDAATAFPSGAHSAEIEIDPETGMIELMRYVAVDDCGIVYNHTIVQGQLLGGMMQGIGQVLGEQCVYDADSGQLLTGSFMDYFMPRADLDFTLIVQDRPVPSPANPLGAKGAGEAGTTGSIPTITNAVIDALRPLGLHHLDIPFTPQRVWAAIHAAKRGT